MSAPADRETLPGLDDDDDEDDDQPPPRPRLEPAPAWSVDRAAPRLAYLCAGWAHRGRALEDLVALVPGCRCSPAVMPRSEVASRLDPGPTRDALLGIRRVAGRLAVVQITSGSAGEGRWHKHFEHHISVPPVDAPDTRGCLEVLSDGRRALLHRGIKESPQRATNARILAKQLFDHGTPDALYVRVSFLEVGGQFAAYPRSYHSDAERRVFDAASYEARPGKLLCLVPGASLWKDVAAGWVDVEEFGPSFAGHPCDERLHVRLLDEFVAPWAVGAPPRSLEPG